MSSFQSMFFVFLTACGAPSVPPQPDATQPSTAAHGTVGGRGAFDTGTAPLSYFDRQYVFAMDVAPLTLLDPASATAIVLTDITSALMDPVSFILEGIHLVGDTHRYGLCPLLGGGPTWEHDCHRDFGAFLNASLDALFAAAPVVGAIRSALKETAAAFTTMHLGATLTLSDVTSGHVQAEIDWNTLQVGGDTIDFAMLGIAPFSFVSEGDAVDNGAGYNVTLHSGPVQFAYADLALGVVEKFVLPRAVPSLDANGDGAVCFAELFTAATHCQDTLCTDAASALATVVDENLLPRLSATLPAAFDVSLGATLSNSGGTPSAELTLTLAGATSAENFAVTATP